MTDEQIQILIKSLEDVEIKQRHLSKQLNELPLHIAKSFEGIKIEKQKDYSSHLLQINERIKQISNRLEISQESKPIQNGKYLAVIAILTIMLAALTYYHNSKMDEERGYRDMIIIKFVRDRKLGIDSIAKYYGMTDEHINYLKKRGR